MRGQCVYVCARAPIVRRRCMKTDLRPQSKTCPPFRVRFNIAESKAGSNAVHFICAVPFLLWTCDAALLPNLCNKTAGFSFCAAKSCCTFGRVLPLLCIQMNIWYMRVYTHIHMFVCLIFGFHFLVPWRICSQQVTKDAVDITWHQQVSAKSKTHGDNLLKHSNQPKSKKNLKT